MKATTVTHQCVCMCVCLCVCLNTSRPFRFSGMLHNSHVMFILSKPYTLQYFSSTLFDSLPGLCQAVQTGFDILLVELDLFVVHLGFLVQPVNSKLESVQFLLALLAVAVLVADVLETDTTSKYTNANTDTHTRTHARTCKRGE